MTDNDEDTLYGAYLRINGSLGIEVVLRFLATSYEKMQEKLNSLVASGAASLTRVGGQQLLALNLAPTAEDNSAAAQGDGSYAYANPVLSDDGSLRVSLAVDGDGQPYVAYSTFSGGSYEGMTALPGAADDDATGCGDSQASLSGTGDFAVAAWTRLTQDFGTEPGAVLTDDAQMTMLNGAEVYASVYDGSDWTTTRLSSNYEADIVPVAAAASGRAIVAWRSVASSSVDTLTDFDQKDAIVFKTWDGSRWSDQAVTLYNGTSGSVKGLTAVILPDGSAAAIAYALDTDGDSGTLDDREIVYAVVDLKKGEVTRTVFATNDSDLDENPQLTAVTIDDEARFVLGWYTQQSVSGGAEKVSNGGDTASATTGRSDIRLMALDASGTPTQQLPDSLCAAGGADMTANFRFTKNAGRVENLSIVWVERDRTLLAEDDFDESMGKDPKTQDLTVERDVLKSVKLYKNGSTYAVTGALDVAEMEPSTLIDHFDAYVSDKGEVRTALLSTTYGGGEPVRKYVTLADGTQASIAVPAQSSAVATETTTYEDAVSVEAVLAEHDTVRPGSTTQVYFEVKNNGIHAIKDLNIQIGETTTEFSDLDLLPGKSARLYADYKVPATISDPAYTVTAKFEGGDSDEATGTILLSLPDLKIAKAQIVREENGERDIRVTLNNALAIPLAGSQYTVRLGFYTDANGEEPLPGVAPVTIASEADLAMIDRGGYSKQVTFEICDYLEQAEQTALLETGLTVYVKAELLKPDGTVQEELGTGRNLATVSVDDLAARTGKDAIVSSTLTNENGASTVAVTVQNAHLDQTTTGNLIVTLLDEGGNALEQQQSYDPATGTGLLTLAGEEKQTQTFRFSRAGASLRVTYSNLVQTQDDVGLASLSFSNLPGITLDSFVYDQAAGQYKASVTTSGLTGTAVLAETRSTAAKAAVSANGGSFSDGSNALSANVALSSGSNTITVRVTAGSETATYVLTVQNGGSGGDSGDSGGGSGGGGGGGGTTPTTPTTPDAPVPPTAAARSASWTSRPMRTTMTRSGGPWRTASPRARARPPRPRRDVQPRADRHLPLPRAGRTDSGRGRALHRCGQRELLLRRGPVGRGGRHHQGHERDRVQPGRRLHQGADRHPPLALPEMTGGPRQSFDTMSAADGQPARRCAHPFFGAFLGRSGLAFSTGL